MAQGKANAGRESDRRAQQNFVRALPKLRELAEAELLHINVNVASSVTTVLRSVPRIQSLRTSLEEALREFDFGAIDLLDRYAWALRHTHTEYLACSRPLSCPSELCDEAETLRQELLRTASALVARCVIDGARLGQVSYLNSYADLASDLEALASILEHGRRQLVDKSRVKEDELDRARWLAQHIVADDGGHSESRAQARDLRARAFTLLFRSYDEVRRGIVYLRWNDNDAEEISPSLFNGSSNGRDFPLASLEDRLSPSADDLQQSRSARDVARDIEFQKELQQRAERQRLN